MKTGEIDKDGNPKLTYKVPCPITISGGVSAGALGGPKIDPCKFNHYGKKCQTHLAAQCPAGTEWVLATQKCLPSGNKPFRPMFNPPVSVAATRAAINQGGGLIQSVVTGRAKVVLDRNGLSMKAA